MPEIGQEYAVYVEKVSEKSYTGYCRNRCCSLGEPETLASINTDLDNDNETVIIIKGWHPDLQGVQIVTPLHLYNMRRDSYSLTHYYQLVTE